MQWLDDVDFTAIRNCVTWIDFADRSTITFRTGTTFIQHINDKSGKNNNFTQATQANQPNWTGTFNGRTVATFVSANWVDSALNTATLGLTNSDYELFASIRTTNNNTTAQAVLTNTTTNERYELQVGGVGTSSNGCRFANGVRADNNAATSNAQQHAICGHINSNISYCMVDGVDGTGVAGGRSADNLLLRIGARQGGTRPFLGVISQIVIYNRVLTSEERAAVIRMLQRY